MDRLTPVRRSFLMSRVRSKNTGPELTVRHALHSRGYRYRLHGKGLPGKPDLVFAGKRKVIFVNGCYWHGHHCRFGLAQSKSNVAFWEKKLADNRRRDLRSIRELQEMGWTVHIVWECEVKAGTWLDRAVAFLDAPPRRSDDA